MDNLLFYSLLIALTYYFMIYLPNQKKTSPDPKFSSTKSTQTDPLPRTEPQSIPDPEALQKLTAENTALLKDQTQKEEELSAKQRTITGLNKSYEELEKKRQQENETSVKQIETLKK